MADTSIPQTLVSDQSSVLSRAKQLLERGELQQAISLLEGADVPGGAAAALRGAAYYRLEQYGQAAQELKKALIDAPADKNLQKLYDRALANDAADVKRHVPEPVYHDAGSLSGGPKPGEHAATTKPPLVHDEKTALFKALGIVIGEKFGHTLQLLTKVLGKETASQSPWTSWYQHTFVRGTIMLARRRERLNSKQLFAAYPKAEGTAFYRNKNAPQWVRTARTADGSWNDLKEPMAGAANVRFGFNTDPTKTPPETGDRLLTPNPRLISRMLLTRKDGFKPVPFLNLTAAAWIQFMNHDWVSYGDPANAEPYRIPLADDDPARKSLHQTHLLVRPTQKDPTRRPGEPQTHINEVTSWWDGSQIYGSDAKTLDALRSHVGGKLALDPKTNNLPVLPDGVEQTGFRRNWWLGLSMLHVLFVREHNAICDMLAVRYPHFSDQRLFDTARLINAAIMAKIHTVEWTPAVLANKTLNAAMNANWYGFLTNLFRSKSARQTLAEINVADPVAGGLVGNTADNHGVPYSLTREFLSVYRLHSLLPDQISLYAIGESKQPLKTWGLAELRQANSHRITDTLSMSDLFYSFGLQNAGQLVLNNFPESLQNLSIPGAGFYDLGAVDVLRDRERGTPRYNQFRRLIGMKPLESIDDLTDDPEARRTLKQVYANIEDVDLLIGNLAESHRPPGFGFGETLFEVFILNASRRLQADRFFTDSYREDIYTAEGLAWIDQVTLKTVLLRHFPDLARTGLANVENAFEPWDVGALDVSRHPLRQYDEGLRELDEKARLQSA
ncbi:MAG TPA: peroxidase family protein [Polyangiales bacterium]|nr:peroxidase family protein [Polyangiales bacterium]